MQGLDGGVAEVSAAGFNDGELEELWSVVEIEVRSSLSKSESQLFLRHESFQDNVATLEACECAKEHVAFDLTSRFRLKVKVR